MIRVGRVDFVNSDPIYYGLENGLVETDVEIKLVKSFPTALNSMLAQGDIDIAPLSTIEYARNPKSYSVLPNLAISSEGEVILLFSKFDIGELGDKKVAVPSTSSTSVALLKILMAKKYDILPEYVTMDPDFDEMLEVADAALMVGDHALIAERDNDNPSIDVYDLGREWHKFTGDRMVYAIWGVTRKASMDEGNSTRA
ncbi:MAG: menaquinone biosynthesis protein [Halobacteria archaeon]|nr:menaquinone biosynthesis protein [Halobacteria archaeon]